MCHTPSPIYIEGFGAILIALPWHGRAVRQFDDVVDEDFVVAPRLPRPVLVNLRAVERCALETLPDKLASLRRDFDAACEVRDWRGCLCRRSLQMCATLSGARASHRGARLFATVRTPAMKSNAGVLVQALKSDGRAANWLGVCTDVLDLAGWLTNGAYDACVLRSVAGRAVLGAGAAGDEELTLNTLESFSLLSAFLRRRVVRYVLNGADDSPDSYVDPAFDSADGACNPVTYRATAVQFVAVACLSVFVQVRRRVLCCGWRVRDGRSGEAGDGVDSECSPVVATRP